MNESSQEIMKNEKQGMKNEGIFALRCPRYKKNNECLSMISFPTSELGKGEVKVLTRNFLGN